MLSASSVVSKTKGAFALSLARRVHCLAIAMKRSVESKVSSSSSSSKRAKVSEDADDVRSISEWHKKVRQTSDKRVTQYMPLVSLGPRAEQRFCAKELTRHTLPKRSQTTTFRLPSPVPSRSRLLAWWTSFPYLRKRPRR